MGMPSRAAMVTIKRPEEVARMRWLRCSTLCTPR
jgi:hypothetical protein